MKYHLRLCLLTTVVTMLLLLPACAGGNQADEERMAVNSCTSTVSANSVLLEYAAQKEVFAKHGLDVSLSAVEGGSNATKALVSGNYDLCLIGGSALANAALAGEDLRVVAAIINQLPYALVTLPEISEPEQLLNQNLAISDFGSSSDTALRLALENVGLDPDNDVVILQIGGQSARMAALSSGSVAGTVVSVPESSIARQEGFNILLDLADSRQPYLHTAIATRQDVIDNDPEMVMRYVSALVEAMEMMKNDREGAIAVLADYLLLDEEEDAAFLAEAYEVMVLKFYDPYPTEAGMDFLLQAALHNNPTDVDVSAAEIVDESFINALEQ